MSPTPRLAALAAAVALAALVLPLPLVALLAVALVAAAAVDARTTRAAPPVERQVPAILARGVRARLTVCASDTASGAIRLRQPTPPDLVLDPSEADARLEGWLVPARRGRHPLPPVAARVDGPLGLGRSYHRLGGEQELLVYPDMPAARRLALAVRRGRFREQGRTRGPLGLGTELESVRDYLPDDDIRQLNWPATARLGRPMSNQYRVEQDRDVTCVVDAGRLMAAPLGADRTRLDAALDASAAVALVADEVGDRTGVVAFDSEVRRHLRPRRRGADAVVRALFDLEPRLVDSDYGLAFQAVGRAKRALVLVFTDVLDEAAAAALLDAVPLLARRHAVVVASASDADLEDAVRSPPASAVDVYAQAAALDVLDARARVVQRLERAGAQVIEHPPERLAAGCVRAYLTAKARVRL